MSELSDAEREAMDLAYGKSAPLDEHQSFCEGWLAARDYYKAEQQAERERLEEMVQKPRLEARYGEAST